MEITTKELRIQPGKIIDQAANGQEIIVTFRGKALAKIVPLVNRTDSSGKEENSIFGLWKNHEDTRSVEESVRDNRKGRQF